MTITLEEIEEVAKQARIYPDIEIDSELALALCALARKCLGAETEDPKETIPLTLEEQVERGKRMEEAVKVFAEAHGEIINCLLTQGGLVAKSSDS